MFRKMRRIDKLLPEEETKSLLEKITRGTFCVNGDGGYPFAMPINFYYEKERDCIYFHSAGSGHKIDSIKKDERVCFTGWYEEGIEEGGWAYQVASVVAYGRASIIEDRDEALRTIRLMAGKYYPTKEEMEEEIEKDFFRVTMVKIKIEHMTGKRVIEK